MCRNLVMLIGHTNPLLQFPSLYLRGNWVKIERKQKQSVRIGCQAVIGSYVYFVVACCGKCLQNDCTVRSLFLYLCWRISYPKLVIEFRLNLLLENLHLKTCRVNVSLSPIVVLPPLTCSSNRTQFLLFWSSWKIRATYYMCHKSTMCILCKLFQ